MLASAVSEDLSQLAHLEATGPADGSRDALDDRRLFGLDAEALAARMVAAGEAEWSGEDMVLPDALPVNPGRPLSELISEDRGPYLPGTDPESP